MIGNMSKFDWNELKLFLVCANAITAAKVSSRFTPLIERRIRALERSLGCRLFDRSGAGMRLTTDGMALLQKVERMDSEFQSIRQCFTPQEELSGQLRISVSGWLESHVLTPALLRFRYSQPQIQVNMLNHCSSSDLVRRKVDVVIQTRQFNTPELIGRKLMRLDYAVYGQTHYLQETPPISAGGHRHTLMMLTGVDSEPAHVQWLDNQFAHASRELLTENPEALLQWCRSGMGLALLPVAVANKHRELLPVPLSSAPPALSVWASYHADSRDSPHLLALLDTARRQRPSPQ